MRAQGGSNGETRQHHLLSLVHFIHPLTCTHAISVADFTVQVVSDAFNGKVGQALN